MIYLDNHSVLVEIKKIKENQFLILDQYFDFIPQNILNNSKNTANWNRALKLKTIDIEKYIDSNFFMMNFEIYFDFEKDDFVLISKNSFFQHILNIQFIRTYLPSIFNFKNRNRKNYRSKTINEDQFWKYNIEISNDENFDFQESFVSNIEELDKKSKYKLIYSIGDKTEVILTPLNQIIYQIRKESVFKLNEIIENIDFINFKKGKFIIKNKIESKGLEMNCNFQFQNLSLADLIKKEIIKEIKLSNIKYKEINLFNITKQPEILIELFEEEKDLLEYLNTSFSVLKINLFSEILQLKELTRILKNKCNEEEFTKLTNRY